MKIGFVELASVANRATKPTAKKRSARRRTKISYAITNIHFLVAHRPARYLRVHLRNVQLVDRRRFHKILAD